MADALHLDGAWHRFEAGLVALASPDASAGDVRRARLGIDDAACDVLMSQETLARHAAHALRERAVQATDLGRDVPTACDRFDPAACGDYGALGLFDRMDEDVRALERPRGSMLARTPGPPGTSPTGGAGGAPDDGARD